MSSFKPKVAPAAAAAAAANPATPAVKDTEEVKQLKIKSGGVKRNIKDLVYARKEIEKEVQRLEKVTATDPDKIAQQKQVVGEAEMMVPVSENRLRQSVADLTTFLENHAASCAQTHEEEVNTARANIADAEKALAGEAPAAPAPAPAAE